MKKGESEDKSTSADGDTPDVPEGVYTLDVDEIDALGDLSDIDLDNLISAAEAGVGVPAPQEPSQENKTNEKKPKAAELPEIVDEGPPDMDIVSPPPSAAGNGGADGEPPGMQDVARLQDRLMRVAADFDNFRKRSRRESEEAVRFANEQILKALLPMVDNLERALDTGSSKKDAKATVQGVRLVLTQLRQDLRRFGLVPFDSVGETFDPKRHEAFEIVPTKKHKPNTVVTEYQKGYLLYDRLLRPSLVVVSAASDDHGVTRTKSDTVDTVDVDTADKTAPVTTDEPDEATADEVADTEAEAVADVPLIEDSADVDGAEVDSEDDIIFEFDPDENVTPIEDDGEKDE